MITENRLKLSRITLSGFKSIHPEGQTIQFGDITVLLGANGSGKSNLVSFFQMLNHMMTNALRRYIGENGSTEAFLHYGSSKTTRITAEIEFNNPDVTDIYKFSLAHAAGDTLIFTDETFSYQHRERENPYERTLAIGQKEAGLPEEIKNPDAKTARVLFSLLKNCHAFQFHDTSKEARIKNKGYINDNRFLYGSGGNLAAYLYAMKNSADGERYYHRIVRYIQQIMPQFSDFELAPLRLNENQIMLNWREVGSDYLFGPHQLSDGSLRFIAIATLLLQPPATLPSVIIIDEPELGLHPSAISILAGMIKTASQHCQIVLATQSPRLVDEFEPKNIVIVERNADNRCSEFRALDEEKLADWLEQYSMSELWEKNVIGGQP